MWMSLVKLIHVWMHNTTCVYIGYYMFTCCIFIPPKWQRWSHVTSKFCGGGALVVAGVESTLHWKLFHFMWHVPFPEARCSRSRWCFQIFSMFHPQKEVKRSIFRLAHFFLEPVAKIPPRREIGAASPSQGIGQCTTRWDRSKEADQWTGDGLSHLRCWVAICKEPG